MSIFIMCGILAANPGSISLRTFMIPAKELMVLEAGHLILHKKFSKIP
jgi:hypothetical protein